jgi:tRNA 5-methylaminomethyl-2-thiouridine biosynthesis bifunctional protein
LASPLLHPGFCHTGIEPRQALVIGAGLSGSAVAHSLASRGWAVTVIDQAQGVGAGASGLPAGLAAPHVSPDDNVLSRITRAGVRATLQRAEALLRSGTDWALTGVLEHNLAGKRRLPKADPGAGNSNSTNTDTNTGADHPHDMSTLASAAQIAASGLPPETPALWHGQAGWIRPGQLVAAQLQTPGVEVLWGQAVHAIERRGEIWTASNAQGQTLGQAPLLVVASAFDSLALLNPLPGMTVPLKPLRGQISFGRMSALSGPQRQLLPPFPVNGHGSFISGVPAPDGQPGWFIGSTFERDCTQAPVRVQDHAANQLRLATLLPDLGAAMHDQFSPEHVQGWAGLRCTLPDRLPAVGPIDSQRLPGLWLCAGMGARGISLAVLCGELAAAWLNNEPLPLPPALVKHLSAERFVQT